MAELLFGTLPFAASKPYLFILTVFGLDGYLAATTPLPLDLESTYYLVGEWFFGAMLLLTLLWPLARYILKHEKYLLLGIMEIATVVLGACLADGEHVLYSLPFCLTSMAAGALIVLKRPALIEKRIVVLAIGMMLTVVVPLVPQEITYCVRALRYQLPALGIFLVIETMPPPAKTLTTPFTRIRNRCAPVLALFSDLTMYVFMFQHVIATCFAEHASAYSGQGFGSFDYWGVALLSAIAAFLVAFVVEGLERKARARIGRQS